MLLALVTPVFASGEVDGSFTAGDYCPPSAVTNLYATANTCYSITLYWTAPGNDGNIGTASEYDIRYSVSPITSENRWNAANRATGAPTPLTAGSSQVFTVSGLLPSTTYYFAMKTADDKANWSSLSNCASATTPALVPITTTPTVPPATSPTTTTPTKEDESPVYIDIKGKRGVIFLELQDDGTLKRTYYITLYERSLEMALLKGTILLDKSGKPVSVIVLEYVDPYGTPPPGYRFLSTYDFQPACVIEPAIQIKMHYDRHELASDVNEADIYIAYYDSTGERWISMDSTRDAEAQCAGTALAHFSLFALLVPSSTGSGSSNLTPMPDLTIRHLTLSSDTVEQGSTLTVNVDLANESSADGVFYIKLMFDGATIDGKSVSLLAMQETTESFTIVLEELGVHTIGVNSMLTTITVYQPVPPPVGLWNELRTPLIWIAVVGLAVIVIFILITRIRKSSSSHRNI